MEQEKTIYTISDTLEINSQLELAEIRKGEGLTASEKELVIAETLNKLIAYKERSEQRRKARSRKTQERKQSSNIESNWSWAANTYRR